MKKNIPLSGIEEIDSGITTTHGSVPWSVKDVAKTTKQTKTEPADYCPFFKTHCGNACAAYNNGECSILTGGAVNASGLCPVTGNDCKPGKCIMYDDNKCKLIERGLYNE